MNTERSSGSQFIVDLGEIKLPFVVEKQVESEIQSVVLRALAKGDVSAGQRLPVDPTVKDIWDHFTGGTLGMWLGDRDNPPFLTRTGGSGQLGVRDHTLIVNAIMEHPMQVLRNLPEHFKVRSGQRPSGREVLTAALQVDQIDDFTKARMRAVLDVLPRIEAGESALSESTKQAVDDLRKRLAGKPIEEKHSVLRDSGLRNRSGDDGLVQGMEFAARMLDDGRDSIYSPDHDFYRMLRDSGSAARASSRDAISDVGSADTIGATVGGAVGSAAGGIGAAPGAVAAGAGASAGAAIAHAIFWLFG